MFYPYYDKTEVLNTDSAKGYRLAETEINEIVLLHIYKGGEVPPHALPVNVVFYVISGKGNITIKNKLIQANTGDVIEVKANIQRSWVNANIEKLELLAIKEKL